MEHSDIKSIPENKIKNFSNKIDSLQVVRAIAFIIIFISHCNSEFPGEIGVSIFLVLSGFCMVYSYYNKNLGTSLKECFAFSKKKISKLYVLHILTTVAAIFISVKTLSIGSKIVNIVLHGILLFVNALLIKTWIPNSIYYYSLNSVSWYLCICIFLCMVFPLILKKLQKSDCKKSIITIICVYTLQITSSYMLRNFSAFNTVSDNFTKWFTYIFPLYRLGDFMIGCCLGHIFVENLISLNKIMASILELFSIAFIILSLYIYIGKLTVLSEPCFCHTVLFIPGSVFFVFSFAQNKGLISKLITTSPQLIWLGNISAYAFLIHQLVIRYTEFLYTKLTATTMNMYIKIIFTFTVTICCCMAYRKIESYIKSRIEHNAQS
ncbi:MAG: acyltransferase [Treponema sp.]|nr:acyltransferase [Treponema sp.]